MAYITNLEDFCEKCENYGICAPRKKIEAFEKLVPNITIDSCESFREEKKSE